MDAEIEKMDAMKMEDSDRRNGNENDIESNGVDQAENESNIIESKESGSANGDNPCDIEAAAESESNDEVSTSPDDCDLLVQNTDSCIDDAPEVVAEPRNDLDKHETSSEEELIGNERNNSVYYLKWFKWNGETLPIVTQNENGPCPLLAIMNVLTLSKKIKLPHMQQIVTSQQLMEYLGDCILSSGPRDQASDELVLNYQQNMQDAISIMHKLQTGIDVNVRFTGVKDFEYTPECVVFDLLSTGLCHGWLMDPQDTELTTAVGSKSYNQLVEKIILSKEENTSEGMAREGLVAEQFLERTRSQLTYHGLCELNSVIKDSELCVFFRNNHFSTLYKYKGELFLLVTDQGYLTESQIIWETLANVEGDGEFVDSSFHTIAPKLYKTTAEVPPTTDENLSQHHNDYLVALSLQNEDRNQTFGTDQPPINDATQTEQHNEFEDQDFALAMQLQNEENQRSDPSQQRQQQQGHRSRQRSPQEHAHNSKGNYDNTIFIATPNSVILNGHTVNGPFFNHLDPF